MRALIYGGGAVGLGIASCLIKSGTHIDIIARADTVGPLQEQGLVRTGIFGDFTAGTGSFRAFETLDQLPGQPYDFILTCTKSFDSPAAATDIAGHHGLLTGQGKVVLFQNGWGNAEVFIDHFDKEVVYNARVITGFERSARNHVKVTVHAAPIHIGSLFGLPRAAVEPLASAIAEGDIPCRTTDEIEKDLWAKMLFNCTLNPLGAILDVPYGTLAEHDSTRDLMDRIVQEIFAVLRTTGYQTHWTRAAAFLQVFYGRLVPDTARHRSSTLQDIRTGKRTEIEALNGAVIRLAQAHGLDVPSNQAVYQLVRFMESRPERGTTNHSSPLPEGPGDGMILG